MPYIWGNFEPLNALYFRTEGVRTWPHARNIEMLL
jgi:hypothetical protein